MPGLFFDILKGVRLYGRKLWRDRCNRHRNRSVSRSEMTGANDDVSPERTPPGSGRIRRTFFRKIIPVLHPVAESVPLLFSLSLGEDFPGIAARSGNFFTTEIFEHWRSAKVFPGKRKKASEKRSEDRTIEYSDLWFFCTPFSSFRFFRVSFPPATDRAEKTYLFLDDNFGL